MSKPPEQVELRISEPVDAEFDPVVVRDAEGARVDAHDARVDPEDARVVLADLEKLSEGSYTVEWRVTSIDGHIVEGRYGFAVAVAGEDRASEDVGGGATSAEVAGAQSRHYAGHDGGGARGVAPPRRDPVPEPAAGRAAIRSFGMLAWGLLLALAVAGVGELSSYAVRASGETLSTGPFWQTIFDSRVGAGWLARLDLSMLTAAWIAAAARSGVTWPWWAAAGTGACS